MSEPLIIPEAPAQNWYMFKPCCMTLFLHDYAQPPTAKVPFLLCFTSFVPQQPRPVPVQMYANFTLEFLRVVSDEELVRMIRDCIAKLDEHKAKIEKP